MFKLISLKVVGDPKLHCTSCEQRVARVLKTLDGVQRVGADAVSQRIEVLFDPAKLEIAAIVERLGLIGYTAEPIADAEGAANAQSAQGRLR